MLHLLPHVMPWYIVGPGMGLSVAGMYALANLHLGVSGSFVQFVDFARGRPVEAWRLWFLAGLLLGGALVAVLGQGDQVGLGYGALGRLLPLGALVPFLLFGGALIGFGARWAGACTSGHGLTGSSSRSIGSMAAVSTVMAVAGAVTLGLHALTGGAL